MTAGLETFAKVRALHDRTDHPGERAAAAGRMEALARANGMTVAEALSKLDAGPAQGRATSLDDLFDTPFFRQAKADHARERAEKWRRVVAEYGSEEAVFTPGPWERALAEACDRFVVRLETTGWRMGSLWGWDLFASGDPPSQVVEAISAAYPLPATVAAAWSEFAFWTKLAHDREARGVGSGDPAPWVFARTLLIERMLDTMPAHSLDDMRGRMSWMDYRNGLETAPIPREERVRLATLRADIERMAVQFGQPAQAGTQAPDCPPTPVQSGHEGLSSPNPATSTCSVQSGQAEGGARPAYPSRRTTAEKRRDVLALLDAEGAGAAPLTDREIARRAGVSPTTVGAIRRTWAARDPAAQGAGR